MPDASETNLLIFLNEELIVAAENMKQSRPAGVNSAGYCYDMGWRDALRKVKEYVEERGGHSTDAKDGVEDIQISSVGTEEE